MNDQIRAFENTVVTLCRVLLCLVMRMNQVPFIDREDAGAKLGQVINDKSPESPYIWAIPAGGVPVGKKVSRILKAPFDLAVVRKLQIPFNPEAGFGATAPDGQIMLNRKLTSTLGLGREQISNVAKKTQREIKRREELFRRNRPYPDLQGHIAIVVDDGFASGYTVLAAVRFLRKLSPKAIWAAAPVASASAVVLLQDKVDQLQIIHVSHEAYFAVASFYENWWDLSDEEVLDYLRDGLFNTT